MIKVNYINNQIIITGHAGYAEAGKDIVCASVSSVVYTTVNGILNINQSSISFHDDQYTMKIEIKDDDVVVMKLIGNMMDLLEELERQYPGKLKISKGE